MNLLVRASYIYIIHWCYFFLVAALSGNFVNFGIFELYGDRALVDALDITVKLILSIPLADIFAFRKVLLYLYAMFSNVLVNCKCFPPVVSSNCVVNCNITLILLQRNFVVEPYMYI